jgi:hypothetical protein
VSSARRPPSRPRSHLDWFDLIPGSRHHWRVFPLPERSNSMGSLVKKRRKKMSKHKYRKRLKANRHKRKK